MATLKLPLQAFLAAHCLQQGMDIGTMLHKSIGLRIQLDLAAVDLGNIQHIVDQAQQEVLGRVDLIEVLCQLFRIMHILARKTDHTADNAERGSDIMTDAGNELRFG